MHIEPPAPIRAKDKRNSALWRRRIADGIREQRKRRRYSQRALALAIGADMSTISDIERGERVPGYETIEKIADLFELPVDTLVGRPIAAFHPNAELIAHAEAARAS